VKKFEVLLEEFRTHTHASSPLGTLDECSLNWKFEEIKKNSNRYGKNIQMKRDSLRILRVSNDRQAFGHEGQAMNE